VNDLLNTVMNNLSDGSLANRVGLTLLHSVWQIGLLALLFATIRFVAAKQKNSSTKIYWLGMATLFLSCALPMATFGLIEPKVEPVVAFTFQDETRNELAVEMVPGSSESRFLLLPAPNADVSAVPVAAAEIGRSESVKAFASRSLWKAADWLPKHSLFWIAVVWIIGATLFSLRTMLGWVHVQKLRAACSKKLSQPIADVAKRALERFPVSRAVEFAVSKQISVPTAIGILRPIVLFPVSALTELSPEQLELIIVHELAHIRRQDVLLNLMQTVIESLLFFHPCIWWVSVIVRAERENCCDDAAVSYGNATQYAKALLSLENCRPTPQLSMAANGGDLLCRIKRLAGGGNLAHQAAPSPWMAGVVGVLILLCSLLFSPTTESVMAQESKDDFMSQKANKDFARTKLGKVLDTEMDKLKQVGFSGSILVAHKGEIILVRSEGFSDADKKQKIRPTNLYEIASTSKSITATAAMILAKRGKLELDASIADYLPGVPAHSRGITVIDLMRHESGIPGSNYGETREDLETAVKTMLAGGPQHDPGSHFEYWNQGYILLGEIITKAAGKPFAEFVAEEIFEPCGMTGTCFCGDPKPEGFGDTTGFGKLGPPRSCLEHPYGKMELIYEGCGGVVSNVVDLWKFHKAMTGDKLLNYESKRVMFVNGDSHYACGWHVTPATDQSKKRAHSGRVRGFGVDFRSFPESDSCIVVLGNSDVAPSVMVANVIEGILLPPKLPGKKLAKKDEKKITGEFKDTKGRMLIVFAGEGEMPTQYMIYWEPKNPAAPISRGSVLENEAGETVFYQPGESDVVELTYSDNKSTVESVNYKDLKIRFKRFDIKAWSKSQC